MTNLSEVKHVAAATPEAAGHEGREAYGKLSDAVTWIFVLDDLARRYHESPFSHITMRMIATAVGAQLADELRACATTVGRKHAAFAYVTDAREAIEQLDELMLGVASDDDITISPSTLGQAMLGFVVTAARDEPRGNCNDWHRHPLGLFRRPGSGSKPARCQGGLR